MNINQALRRISTIKGQLATWQQRLRTSIVWREDEQAPAWKLDECKEQLVKLTTEQLKLEAAVARANALSEVEFAGEKLTLAGAVRRLAALKSEISLFSSLPSEKEAEHTITEKENVYINGDVAREEKKIKVFCALPERERAEHVEKAKELFDGLNAVVESANHTVQVTL